MTGGSEQQEPGARPGGQQSEAAAVLQIAALRVALPAGADRPFGVDGVELALRPREIVCVVGESGSGKSLIARSILGLHPPGLRVSGRIDYRGQNLVDASAARLRSIRGADIAMIFQEPMTALNPLVRIGRQIEEVLTLHTALARVERQQRVTAALQEVGLADTARILRAFPHELSGGQRQRAMIAMALLLQPRVLLADEPTTALDVTTQAQVLSLIRTLQQRHDTAVLFITHDFGVVADIADRVIVMRVGQVVEQGPTARLLDRPEHPYTRALLRAVPRLRTRFEPLPAAPVKLRADGLAKTYAGRLRWWPGREQRQVVALKPTSLQLERGRVLGIVGESGSGKSTLARLLVRLVRADAGRLWLDEQAVRLDSRRADAAFCRKVQIVFQDPFGSLNPRIRIGDSIAAGPIIHGQAAAPARAKARELLALVGLDPKAADRYPHQFSGGQRQRIAIARALALEPEVLVADEPVSALDVSVQAQILALLDQLRPQLGLAMVFITHDLSVASQISDSVVVMRAGEIVEEGDAGQVFGHPAHPYTRSLLAAIPGVTRLRQTPSADTRDAVLS